MGVVRLSNSGKVVNLGIFEGDSKKWFIVDIEALFDVVEGKRREAPVLEAERDE